MNQPFFSICIAAYNAERYIDKCLRSISVQNYRNFEVVIVDDGSVEPLSLDDSVRVGLPSCTLVRIVNSGPYAARQAAFDVARGEVVLCVDADDSLLDPLALTKIRRAFADGNPDVVLFNASSSDRAPSCLYDFSTLGRGGAVADGAVFNLFTRSFSLNSLWCKAFKRALYHKGEKPRPRLLMAEDRLQSLEIMGNAHSYWLIDEPLYFYRPNPESTTNAGFNPEYYRQACYVEEEVIAFMQKRNMKIDSWSRYFLQYTSRALLGIRYNRSLDGAERRLAYVDVRGEKSLAIAENNYEIGSLPGIDRVRLSLLRKGSFLALDLSMLPWRIGSDIKRIVVKLCHMLRK